MSIWVLDDGPFGTLARIFDSSWRWPAGTLHMVKEVADGAATDKSGRRRKLLAMSNSGSPCVTVHEIMVGTPAEAMLYEYLRPDSAKTSKDLGEDASIAFCAKVRPDAIFVTQDKQAALIALAELGPGRVATPFELWHHMLQQGLISPTQFDDLCESTRKSDSWWPGIPLRLRRAT